MTSTAPATAPRLNGYGRPCPEWCQIDHSQPLQDGCVGSGSVGTGIELGPVWTRAVLSRDRSYVAFSGSLPDTDAHWPDLNLDLAQAEDMAILVGLLADLTPDQHRELAAAIRRAAAAVTPSADLASCGHPRNEDGECDCASWPERAPGT